MSLFYLTGKLVIKNCLPNISNGTRNLVIPKTFTRLKCDFDTSTLPETATVLSCNSKEYVVLVGTVHFSKESLEDVSRVMKEVVPNIVMLELCPQRISILTIDDETFLKEAKDANPQKIRRAVKGQSVKSGIMHAILLKSYAKMATDLEVAPGGEFRRAYHELLKIPGCQLFLGDRPINTTIRRAFGQLSMREIIQIIFYSGSGKQDPMNTAKVEKYKDPAYIEREVEEVTRELPVFRKIFHVFVKERDVCMAYSLQQAVATAHKNEDMARVVGVVGMGHVPGIINYYGKVQREDVVPLMTG